MPPKQKKITIQTGLNAMDVFLKRPSTVKATSTEVAKEQKPNQEKEKEKEKEKEPAKAIKTEHVDPNVVGFMASLTPNERIAHTIAVEKLGTSYDIYRTHGYVQWFAKNNSKAA